MEYNEFVYRRGLNIAGPEIQPEGNRKPAPTLGHMVYIVYWANGRNLLTADAHKNSESVFSID